MKLNLIKPIAFFDLETTGVNPSSDRIVEISILKVEVDGTEIIYTKKVNPTIPIPLETSMVHGIYDKDVKDAPTFKELAQEIQAFMENCDLAGYNLKKFDVPLLIEEFLRVDIDFDLSGRNIVDAQVIFHKMEARTLSAAYKFYCGKDLENAHSAEADNLATYEVLKAQLAKYQSEERTDEKGNKFIPIINDMKALAELSPNKNVDPHGRFVWKNGVEVFGFGKHKDKSVVEILKSEKGYYDWMMKSDFALSTKNELKKIKLKMLQDSF